MLWAYGVTTVLTRTETLLPATLASLSRAGFDRPHLFLDGASPEQAAEVARRTGLDITSRAPPRVGCYGNWMLGFFELLVRCPDADRFAMFQDDIEVVANLRPYLESCRYPEKGYLNLFTMPPAWQVSPPDPAFVGWRQSNQLGKGALGLVFDRRAVMALLSNREAVGRVYDAAINKRQRNLDGLIAHVLCDKWRGEPGGREWVHFPSLAQHKGTCTTVRDFIRFLPDAPSFPGGSFDAMSWAGWGGGQPAQAPPLEPPSREEEIERVLAAMAADEARRAGVTDPRELKKLDRWKLIYQERLRALS